MPGEAISRYLDAMHPMDREEAEGRVGGEWTILCACVGSPFVGPETRGPCHCELLLMKAQRTLGQPEVGWDTPEV